MSSRGWSSLGKTIAPRWGTERQRAVRIGIARRGLRRHLVARAGAAVLLLALAAGAIRAILTSGVHVPNTVLPGAPGSSIQ